MPKPTSKYPALGLDLATHTGWALVCGDHHTSGVWNFTPRKTASECSRYHALWQRLNSLNEQYADAGGIQAVYYERVKFVKYPTAGQVWAGFHAVMGCWCEHKHIVYRGVDVGALKLFATGNGRADKDEMVSMARMQGFQPQDDNEADAIHVLLWGLHTRTK